MFFISFGRPGRLSLLAFFVTKTFAEAQGDKKELKHAAQSLTRLLPN